MYLEGFSGLFFQKDFSFISENAIVHCKHTCKNSFSENTQIQYFKPEKPSIGFSCYYHSQASTYVRFLWPLSCHNTFQCSLESYLRTSQSYKQCFQYF